jgi:hypothetical protein
MRVWTPEIKLFTASGARESQEFSLMVGLLRSRVTQIDSPRISRDAVWPWDLCRALLDSDW